MKFKFFLIATTTAILYLAGCGDKTSKQQGAAIQQPTAQTQAPAPEPAAAPQPKLPKLDYANLVAAIDGVKPLMSDTFDTPSDGAMLLTLWARTKMKWSELKDLPQGKYGLVMKDSETQRGNRICVDGMVIEIAADSSAGDPKVYFGGLVDDRGQFYRFFAVKSTGELVQQSRAAFCGVVIGRHDYKNSVGGVAHAIQLVGMFDLPENRL